MATTTGDMVAEVAVCVPMPRVAEGVEWAARKQLRGRVQVTLWRPCGLPVDVEAAFRARALAQCTIRTDVDVEEAVVALAMSDQDVPAGVAGVAAAVVAGFDQHGSGIVRHVVMAVRAVKTGLATQTQRECVEAFLPDPARLVRCRAAVDELVSTGLTRTHLDETCPRYDVDPMAVFR